MAKRNAGKRIQGTHNFTHIEAPTLPRSSFNRSHGHKTAFDSSWLVPVLLEEALPGDTMNVRMSTFARFATLKHPILDNMVLSSQFWAIPYRLVWSNWHKFMGEEENPGDSTDFSLPQLNLAGTSHAIGSIGDHFGIPTGVIDIPTTCLYHRAYTRVWNEWYRDENLQVRSSSPTTDGPDSWVLFGSLLRKRGKRKDYITSCLPWPQKGAAVTLPLGTSAPVTGIGSILGTFPNGARSVYETDGTGTVSYADTALTSAATDITLEEDPNNTGFPNIRADLSNATAASINQIREAFAIQKMLERDARSGTRLTEIIQGQFGVTSEDSRLQRPEYLGGGEQPINISPVPQTSETLVGTPQGNLGAIGTSAGNSHSFTKSFTEHCIVIGLVSVRGDITYQQGLDRKFSRISREDFYLPAFAHLGEQAVLNKEVFADGTAADELVWGYQERWSEYRYNKNVITGIMRSAAPASLDVWHIAEDFSVRPLLNAAFIEDNPAVDRVIAVPAEPHFLFDAWFDFKHVRVMPTYSTPGQMDRF